MAMPRGIRAWPFASVVLAPTHTLTMRCLFPHPVQFVPSLHAHFTPAQCLTNEEVLAAANAAVDADAATAGAAGDAAVDAGAATATRTCGRP